jgi:hypothetical protein
MRKIQKILVSGLGLAACLSPSSGQEPQKRTATDRNRTPASQPKKAAFTKDELIAALKQLNLSVDTIRVVAAMCYEPAFQSEDIDFHCTVCGRKAHYKRSSNEGLLVDKAAFIQRVFGSLPYKMKLDTSRFCSHCGKGAPKVLIMHIACFECGEDVSWKISTYRDIERLEWLRLKPPITELDGTILNIPGGGAGLAEGVREGIAYIRDHIFCPQHRDVISNFLNVQK